MWKCPKCDSRNIDTYRMPVGAMWCEMCGFRIEHKELKYNPFIVEKKEKEEENNFKDGYSEQKKFTIK